MGNTYNFKDLSNMHTKLKKQSTSALQGIDTLESKVSLLVGSTEFTGQGADAIKAYFGDVYSISLNSLQRIINDFVFYWVVRIW